MKKRILHFSDLHLAGKAAERRVSASMAKAIRWTVKDDGKPVDLVAITGDIFTTSALDPDRAMGAFRGWFDEVTGALGNPPARTLIVPGNHDVRRVGVVAPHQTKLVARLGELAREDAWAPHRLRVHGAHEPEFFQVQHVPREEHPLEADVLLLDSTYLARGWLSAGGVVRPDDLLEAVSALPAGAPLIVLMHHHLVPTPVTDNSLVTYPDRPVVTRGLRWLLGKILSNADHEELSMTASGVGTALGLLHALDRPVLVLHGHKHYATVRLLRGVSEREGDVLLASAGSAGTAEPWRPSRHDRDAIWPSFNVVDFDGDEVAFRTVAYPREPERSDGAVTSRLLLRARRAGSAWDIVERGKRSAPAGGGPKLAQNRAVYHLQNPQHEAPRWTALVERTVKPVGDFTEPYREFIDGPLDTLLDPLEGMEEHLLEGGKAQPEIWSTEVEFGPRAPHRYRLVDGLMGTFDEAKKCYGERTAPYEWVDLFNRYGCDEAELVLRGYPATGRPPFGSVMDLTSGLETPATLAHEGGDHILRVRGEEPGCAPRSLLRIWWPLG